MIDRAGALPGSEAIFAQFDEASATWVAKAHAILPVEGATELDDVSGPGQYALVVPDTGDGAPIEAVLGEPLGSGSLVPIPEGSEAFGTVTPPVGRIDDPTPAAANITFTFDTALRSATPLQGDFMEIFVLRGGGKVAPLATSQDLFAYRLPSDLDGRTLAANFPIAPSRVFSPLEASEGTITVSLLRTPTIVRDVIATGGGGIETDDGSRLIIPPGALATGVAVRFSRLSEDEFPVETPFGLVFLGALEVDLSGAVPSSLLSLTLGGRASFVPTGAQVVVAEARIVRGQERLIPVALGRIDGDDITAVNQLGAASLPGVSAGGRYGFYLFDGPLEIVSGTAREESGRRDGLLVEIEEMPFVSVTDTAGFFTLLSPPGAFTLVATAAFNLDRVRLSGDTSVPLPDVVIGSTPPRVELITVRPPRIEGNFAGPAVLLGKPAPLVDDDILGESSGNDNGQIDPGERIELTLAVRNDGNVAVEGGFFVLGVRGSDDAINVTPDRLPNGTLPPDEPVSIGPFVFEVPAGSDPSLFRYILSRFTDDGRRPNEVSFDLPLDVEHLNVPVDSEVQIHFSEPVRTASLEDAVSLEREDGVQLVPVSIKLLLSDDEAVTTLRPLAPLADDTVYRVTITDAMVDRDGRSLADAPVVERFRTEDLTPPAPIDPGQIEASIPDDEGLVTVTGSLGSVNPENTLIVLNESTGFTVVATVEADGSFVARILTQIHERLRLIQYDESGNETTIDVGGFVRRDPITGEVLSVVVGREGGTVESPEGIVLTVPTGAVLGATELSVSRVEEAFELPADIVADPDLAAAFERQFTVVDRIEIEADVPQFTAPVRLSVPLPPGAQEGDLFVVTRTRPVTVGGPLADLDNVTGLTPAENPLRSVERLEVLDSATVKDEGGKLVVSTDSPPFPGITEPGILTLLKVEGPLTFIAGDVRRDTADGLPIENAVVQSLPGALETSAFAAITDGGGRFIVADAGAGGPYPEGAGVASRLDVLDPEFIRVIRRDVRAVVGPPAPPATVVAHLNEPFVLPATLPGALVDALGDLEPPQVQILMEGSSLSSGATSAHPRC